MFGRSMLRRVGMVAAPFALAGATLAGGDRSAVCLSAPKLGDDRRPTVVRKTGEWPLRAGEPVPITVEYFLIRAVGELPRLLLEVLDVPYDCVFHYTGAYFKPYAPFGQVPIYREGDLVISQRDAIARHIANKFGIAGCCPASKAKVDMFFELSKDLKGKKAAIYDMENHPDGEKLKMYLAPAEAACDGKHFVGKTLTLADVAMFEVLSTFKECAPHSLDKYPALSAFVTNFAARPQVAAYFASPRRLPISANERGDKPHAGMAGYALDDLDSRVYAEEWSLPYAATGGK